MRRILYGACLAAGLLIAGCDASLAPAHDDLTPEGLPDGAPGGPALAAATLATSVGLGGAEAGDFYYALTPLVTSDTFYVALAGSGGSVLLRHYRDAADHDWLDVAGRTTGTPTAVTIRYRDGSGVLDEEAAGGSGSEVTWYAGPELMRAPTSYHYVVHNGEVIVTVDYEGEESAPDVHTLGGAWVQPTHVDFVLSGVGVGTPGAVAFARALGSGTGLPPSWGDSLGFALTGYQLQ